MQPKATVVVHSGGMDSSICLALAMKRHGPEQVLSLSFDYGQRHSAEIVQAQKICREWAVDHITIPIPFMKSITRDALTDGTLPIKEGNGAPPSTLVVGRNGLMGRIAAIHAHSLGAASIYMGVIEVEMWNSGYRDCSRDYMDKLQTLLRIDLDNPAFTIETPLVFLTKSETLQIAHNLGVLDVLLTETITCYNGIRFKGCQTCPSCQLRNAGIREFASSHPECDLSSFL